MKRMALLGAVVALLPVIAGAQSPATIPVREAQPVRTVTAPVENFVQAYYVPSNHLRGSGDSISGNGGFGAAGLVAIGSDRIHPFIIGDYEQTDYKDLDQTVKDIRFGAGVQFLYWLGAYAEYADIKFNNSLDGIGIHVRFTPKAGPVNLMFQLGYLDLKNSNSHGSNANGTDIGVGAGMHFTPRASVQLDYRVTVLSPKDGGDSLTIDGLRVGARLDF